MWNAHHIVSGVQIQRTAAAMSALSEDAQIDGLLWYQVIFTLSDVQWMLSRIWQPSLHITHEAQIVWTELCSCRANRMRTVLRRCKAM